MLAGVRRLMCLAANQTDRATSEEEPKNKYLVEPHAMVILQDLSNVSF
jgi:hypothetical protein